MAFFSSCGSSSGGRAAPPTPARTAGSIHPHVRVRRVDAHRGAGRRSAGAAVTIILSRPPRRRCRRARPVQVEGQKGQAGGERAAPAWHPFPAGRGRGGGPGGLRVGLVRGPRAGRGRPRQAHRHGREGRAGEGRTPTTSRGRGSEEGHQVGAGRDERRCIPPRAAQRRPAHHPSTARRAVGVCKKYAGRRIQGGGRDSGAQGRDGGGWQGRGRRGGH
jgi:hypothetical protein